MAKQQNPKSVPKISILPVSEIVLDPVNARAHTSRNLTSLKQSLKQFGQTKPIVVSKDGICLAGNGTVQAARELEWKTIAAVRVDLEGEQARAYAIADNRTAELAEWDYECLANLMGDLDHRDLIGWSDDEINDVLSVLTESVEDPEEDEPAEATVDPIWPGEPEWDVPLLREDRQAQTIEHPLTRWGSIKRKTSMHGTYHFYTDDEKFKTIWDNPGDLLLSGCPIAIEPNYTVIATTPKAVALWAVYRKRWLNRYWQQNGVLTVVDLNLGAHMDLALMGVPKGWGAYATRCHSDDDNLKRVKEHYKLAKSHAGKDPHLFAVFGGGMKIKRLCSEQGWTWCAEDAQTKR